MDRRDASQLVLWSGCSRLVLVGIIVWIAASELPAPADWLRSGPLASDATQYTYP